MVRGLLFVAVGPLAGCAALIGADFDRPSASETGATADGGGSGATDAPPGQPATGADGGAGEGQDPDGGATSDDAMPSTRCSGTATTCTALAARKTDCYAQSGCAWSDPTCTLTTDCTAFKTNTECENAPGCATDITTSTCKPVAGYCYGTSAPACVATTSCAFTGGCSGSARSCNAITEEASCKGQGGCSWQ